VNVPGRQYATVANAVGYQLVWFACVAGAAAGRVWPGLLAAAVFMVATLRLGGCWRADVRTLAIAVPLGFGLDSAFAAAGWLAYDPPGPWPLAAPAWIAALWLGFAMTLNHSLRFLRRRPVAAALLGMLGAPLAYLGAARGFGVLAFATPWPPVLLALALAWGLLLPAIFALDARLHPTPAWA
jgi:hypothetical protein